MKSLLGEGITMGMVVDKETIVASILLLLIVPAYFLGRKIIRASN